MHKRTSPHRDFDHMGETIKLFNKFKKIKHTIKNNVIFGKNEYNNLESNKKYYNFQ